MITKCTCFRFGLSIFQKILTETSGSEVAPEPIGAVLDGPAPRCGYDLVRLPAARTVSLDSTTSRWGTSRPHP